MRCSTYHFVIRAAGGKGTDRAGASSCRHSLRSTEQSFTRRSRPGSTESAVQRALRSDRAQGIVQTRVVAQVRSEKKAADQRQKRSGVRSEFSELEGRWQQLGRSLCPVSEQRLFQDFEPGAIRGHLS